MAQWKETREPYVDVHEKVKVAALNPRAGEDLIIGCALISDAGPSIPTLITSQSEFLATYSSEDLTKDYVSSLNKLYKGDISDMAETMWLNAYRLAGANTMLVVRASKAKDIYFAKPLVKGENPDVYILRDGQLLKKVQEFKIVVDVSGDNGDHSTDGWSININGIGVIGNRNDDDGAQYDYFVKDIIELVDCLNDTSKFFSPSYTFYNTEAAEEGDETEDASEAVSVVFHEVYLGQNILDTTDARCPNGLSYVVTCEPEWSASNPPQHTIDLNDIAFSDFEAAPFYATNNFNSSTELKLRIRRFNHDAVVTKELSKNDAYAGGDSPYTVLSKVLDTFTNNGTNKKGEKNLPTDDVLYRDFYEVAVVDPSISDEPVYFNVGNILGRGDMTEAELNESLKMIQVQLPDDLGDLGLGYYGYLSEANKTGWKVSANQSTSQAFDHSFSNKKEMLAFTTAAEGDIAIVGRVTPSYYQYKVVSEPGAETEEKDWILINNPGNNVTIKYRELSIAALKSSAISPTVDEYALVGEEADGVYYEWVVGTRTLSDLEPEEIFVDLSIDPEKYRILDVSDNDIMKALDQISLDEVYVTEGLADLGCTSPMVQSYMANMAVNDNYFYPISTINSTNYLAIANSINRISKDSYKLYASAPWDVDTGNVGFKYYASPATLYWETVGRNRNLGREFAPVLGQSNGIAQYQKPVVEFNKKTRQLLLSKKINTVMWNTQTQAWNWNDNWTKSSEDTIMSDDGNSRLAIRIAKAMPVLLRQFIGRRIGPVLWQDMTSVIDFWFKNTILPMEYTIDAYQITINETNNPVEIQRRNQVKCLIEIRFQRAAKYIDVFDSLYDIGMPFDSVTWG